ncbi:putative DNA-binding transcriptional regulator YafY [Cohnella lubricantis]|nr:putative DNA-binding transcriptional regulator YafY [Cohnella lubricantis]
MFRCDRVLEASAVETGGAAEPLAADRIVHLGNWRSFAQADAEEAGDDTFFIRAELTREGVQRCEGEIWLASSLHMRPDGTGRLEGRWPKRDIPFYAKFFIGLGEEASLESPPELAAEIRRQLAVLAERYRLPGTEL